MPSSHDTAEPIASEAELLLVDLLYGELDEAEASAARARIEADADLRSELAALEDLRSVWSRLADEEPPAAVTSKLVHAASAGGSRAAIPAIGLWAAIKRWFQAGSVHPGVYAFATLILIAGVAGSLYLRGSGGADRSLVESQAPAPERNEAAGAGAELERVAEPVWSDEAVTGGLVGGESGADDGDQVAREPKPDEAPRASRPADDPAPRRAEGSSGKGASSSSGAPAGNRSDVPADKKKSPSKTRTQSRSSSTRGALEDQTQQAPPPPPAPGPSAVAGDRLDIDTEEAELKEQAPQQADRDDSEVRELHRKATAAAKRGDCAEALRLGQQIRKLDGRYFDTDFLADPVIRECRKQAPSGY